MLFTLKIGYFARLFIFMCVCYVLLKPKIFNLGQILKMFIYLLLIYKSQQCKCTQRKKTSNLIEMNLCFVGVISSWHCGHFSLHSRFCVCYMIFIFLSRTFEFECRIFEAFSGHTAPISPIFLYSFLIAISVYVFFWHGEICKMNTN